MSSALPWTPLLVAWLAVAIAMAAAWMIQLKTRDAGVVDFVWSAGIGVVALAMIFVTDGWGPRRVLVGVLAGAWSLRLAAYILRDRLIGEEEDGRYRTLRESWGDSVQPFFAVFFQVQGLLVVVFQLPLVVAMSRPAASFDLWDVAGVSVFLVAIAGEALADRQLARFRASPSNRGKTCREGLWRYSRHPNYFFEWVHWWAYVLIGIPAAHGWITLLGPLLMLLFLYKVTGIPATEAQALKSRGDDYRDYQRTTSAFFPWPPRADRP